MRTLVFDFEANGLLKTHSSKPDDVIVTRVHCLCIKDVDGGPVFTFTDYQDEYPSIPEGLAMLDEADEIVGHNIIRYDIPLAQKFFGWTPKARVRCTQVLSQMGYTNLYEKDKRVAWKKRDFPRSFTGLHSLRAWGYRIGMHKGQVNDNEDYSICTPEMLEYCARDVEVNAAVYQVFRRWADKIPMAVEFEHEFFIALEEMMTAGWLIDKDAAAEAVETLEAERIKLEAELYSVFPSRTVPALKDAKEPENKFWNPKQLKTKEKTYPFKPGSAMQVAYWLNKLYDWYPKPSGWTKTGKASITDEILESLPFPEAQQLARYAMVTKRLGSLIGPHGYVTLLQEDGRLHGRIDHCGCITHRCSHSNPNLANATGLKDQKTGKVQPYGREIRQCFTVPECYRLVGADASGLELRLLSNRMAPHDGGDYAREVVDGDAHTRNRKAADLDTRARAKRFIYALMYGAGNELIGEIKEPEGAGWSPEKRKREGGKVKKRFFQAMPAMKKVIDDLKAGFRPGQKIYGLDGRYAENRSAHQALNTQIQQDGAIVMKYATVLTRRKVLARGWRIGVDADCCMVGHIHDEMQWQAREEIADELGRLCVESITEAGKMLSVACRLDGEYSVGSNWADTH
jgi:DNA polymerase I-like protein with 3'-5' exonuclease and polymerase domains